MSYPLGIMNSYSMIIIVAFPKIKGHVFTGFFFLNDLAKLMRCDTARVISHRVGNRFSQRNVNPESYCTGVKFYQDIRFI